MLDDVEIELESSLPVYRSEQARRDAEDVQLQRMRVSTFEEADIVGVTASLIAKGEQLYALPPGIDASVHNQTYAEIAARQFKSGALKDIFLTRKVGDQVQVVCVANLAPRPQMTQ